LNERIGEVGMNQIERGNKLIIGIVCGLLLLIPAADAANTLLYDYTFLSDNQSWVYANTTCGTSACTVTRGWNSTDGIPAGSLYYNQSATTTQNRDTESAWSSPNLAWSNGTPTSATLDFSYKVMVGGSGSTVTIRAYIIKTDNTGVLVYQGNAITTNTSWLNLSVPVGTNNFTTAGNYKIRLNGTLHTTNPGTAVVRWDNANLTLIWEEIPQTYIPPAPALLTSSQGNFWINYSWQEGSSVNKTDSYNVSVNNYWTNGTTQTFNVSNVGAHGWSNISVYAFNNSGGGSLSSAPNSSNTQVANNVPVQTLLDTWAITAGNMLTFTVSASDADPDTLTFSTNATGGTLNTSNGAYSWMPSSADAGAHFWFFSSNDGYGGITKNTTTITVTDVSRTYINGTVRSGEIGVEGVTVSTNTSISTTTDSSGFYSLPVTAGTYQLTAAKDPVYYTNSSVIAAVASGVVVQDIQLVIKPTGTITGNVTNV
jgi:hypothetical protein